MNPPVVSERSLLCQSHREEMASMLTHALGVVLSVVALIGMLITSGGDFLKSISAAVFGGSLILLYGFSTLYHLYTDARRKQLFQTLDHVCIYLLIAATYTPISIITLRGPWGWTLFSLVWTMAIVGLVIKTKNVLPGRKKNHWLSTVLYLAMGWLALIAIGPVVRAMPPAGLAWLVGGGLSYTFGVIFYSWRSLPYHHAIWHLFVLGGSACHVIAIWLYVLR
ncbi:hemolysin III family protein [Phragmitibacter flavus]|uniref:Hemolysin III family protein n=1 Tax=Phragmitibacter flavus TaxID=2576071 RepID=A0A5R8KFQ3_9BACT|nr:hemolysin III family protein [Phragmitibacter flavus]TLD71117.1 hemolysin III family protein [Phragmitibacter flavus]